LDGALSDHHTRRLSNDKRYRQVIDYYRTYPRLAIYHNGDHVKLISQEKVDWTFSPRLDWNDMPKEVINKINNYNCMWDYFGKFVQYENNGEEEAGFRNNFFIMKSEGKWMFRMKKFYAYGYDYWEAYKPLVPKERFQLFQNFKVYGVEKDFWVNEESFRERYQKRSPLTLEKLYEKFILKYETVFNWLCVSFE
jgi:hypothetical protein